MFPAKLPVPLGWPLPGTPVLHHFVHPALAHAISVGWAIGRRCARHLFHIWQENNEFVACLSI